MESAKELLAKHTVYTDDHALTEVVIENGMLKIGGTEFKMTDAFAPRLLSLLKLPNKNMDVLDNQHLASDINYRIGYMNEDRDVVIGVRFFDNNPYDVFEIKKDKLVLPIKHSVLLDQLFTQVPEIENDATYDIKFDHVQGLRLKTFASRRKVVREDGKTLVIGLSINNIDYNKSKYGTSVGFNVYDTQTKISYSNINQLNYKIKHEGSKAIECIAAYASLLIDTLLPYMQEAIKLTFEQPLTEQVFQETRERLQKALGKKDADSVMLQYLTNDGEDPDMCVLNREVLDMEISEFDFMESLALSVKDFYKDPSERDIVKLEKAEKVLSFALSQNLTVVKIKSEEQRDSE